MAIKREQIGSILKSNETGQTDYIKISKTVTLKEGEFLQLENSASIAKSADFLEKEGKVSPEIADKMRERAGKMPSFVRFNIVRKITD